MPPASLTQVPRELRPRGKARSFSELPVRIWVILSVAIALITIYFVISRFLQGRELRRLLSEGKLVHASIIEINGTKDRTIVFKRSDPLRVWVGFELPNERNVVAEGPLAQLAESLPLRVGDPIDIRVDPSHLEPWDKPGMKRLYKWTDRTAPPPWYVEYAVVLLLLPLFAMVGAIALWRRIGVVKVWRNGEVSAGVVVDLKQTAVAPFSRIVRFTLADGSDRRVFSTLHPAKDAPRPGDVIWLIFPAGKPSRAIVASLYQ